MAAVLVGFVTQAGTSQMPGHGPRHPTTVVVQPGDTLGSIAAASGVSVADLAEANGIWDPSHLRVGQQLVLPNWASDRGGDEAEMGVGVGNDPAGSGRIGTDDSPASLPAALRRAPDRLALRPVFARWGQAYGVDPALVEAVCWMESGWQNDVVSPVGARGIGQLMPATVDHMSAVIGVSLDPGVPEDNIRMSARMLAFLLEQTGGDERTAVASYAQGLRSVQTHGPGEEVRSYVELVVRLHGRFAAAR